MKRKWFLGSLILLLFLGYEWMNMKSDADLLQESDAQNEGIVLTETPSVGDGFTIQLSRNWVFQGDLLLVNKDHPVPDRLDAGSEAVSLFSNPELIDGFGVADRSVMLSHRLAEKLRIMIKDAAKDGVTHFMINSGYRTKAQQEELYQMMGAQLALPPGYSEHNLGLSMDIGSSQAEMNQAAEGAWLKDHAWKYGFILRYPEDKTKITGIQYEPWHFRYVGLPHSAIMQKNNLVLEQYLEMLKNEKSLSATVGSQHYRVFYYPVDGDRTVTVPARGPYDISGNNQDGVVITVCISQDSEDV